MRNTYKVMLGSLVGAVAIHVVFVACGNNGGTGANGVGEAGAEGGMLDALLDQIGSMIDGTTKDARADTDSGADGGTCGCTVTLQGPVKSVSADSDSAQLRGGAAKANGVMKVVEGPFVLTDATVGEGEASEGWAAGWGGETQLTLEPTAASCSGGGTVLAQVGQLFQNAENGNQIHAGRYVVPSGKMLCAEGNLIWSGFVPYQ